ncbi:MAG: hypothetical protein ABIQ57_15620 [Candidatus Kapaibacterium sp.]
MEQAMSEQTPNEGHHVTVTGNTTGQIVIGNQNRVTMMINAEKAGITEDDRDQMRGLLDELRARMRAAVPVAGKEDVLKEARAISKEVEAEEPDASVIKRAIEWIGGQLPSMSDWAGKVIVTPFVAKAMEAAGTAITGIIGGL